MTKPLPLRGRCRAQRGGGGAEGVQLAPSVSLWLTAPPEGE
jgi:hypothetical protein